MICSDWYCSGHTASNNLHQKHIYAGWAWLPPSLAWCGKQLARSPRNVRTHFHFRICDQPWDLLHSMTKSPRYVAQQCSQPVSLLGDQKGLRMIKVGGLHHSWLSLEKGHCIKQNLLFYFQLLSWSDQMEKFFRLALSGFSEEPEQPPPRTSRFFSSDQELFFILFEGGRVHPKQSGSGASWHTIPLSPITGSTFDHHHYYH